MLSMRPECSGSERVNNRNMGKQVRQIAVNITMSPNRANPIEN